MRPMSAHADAMSTRGTGCTSVQYTNAVAQ
jgi:hypothetical protein